MFFGKIVGGILYLNVIGLIIVKIFDKFGKIIKEVLLLVIVLIEDKFIKFFDKWNDVIIGNYVYDINDLNM